MWSLVCSLDADEEDEEDEDGDGANDDNAGGDEGGDVRCCSSSVRTRDEVTHPFDVKWRLLVV